MYVHIWIVYFIYTHAGSTDVSRYNNKIPPLIKYNSTYRYIQIWMCKRLNVPVMKII